MKYLITENFGKKLNLFFTDKCKTSNNVILTKQNETLNDKKIPTPFTSISRK